MTFGTALELLKMGLAVRHSSWNEEEFIYLTIGTEVSRENLRGNCAKFHPSDYERNTINISSHIDKHISEEKITIGWVPTAEEMFSDEWYVYNDFKN